MAWQAPELGRLHPTAMVLAVVLAVGAGLLGRWWWLRTPYDIGAAPIRGLWRWPRMGWYLRPFLGWWEGPLGLPIFAMGREEDSVGTVGPPRVNKTSGSGIAQALLWGGALISVSQTPLLMRKTGRRRRLLAKLFGGRVLVYAPTSTGGKVEGLVPVRFSPCSADANEVTLRVESWITAAETSKNVEDQGHWQTGAGFVLRGLMWAAAHHPTRPGDFTLVYDWIVAALAGDKLTRDHALDEPLGILWGRSSWDGNTFAKGLAAVNGAAEKERASFMTASLATIKAAVNPAVLSSTAATDFDIERFILTRSTLYIVSPTEHQRAVAPLIAMLVETIVHTAYRLYREGKLGPREKPLRIRLGLQLDDLANVAPLPQLESIISQGGGQGVNVFWSLQSLAQLSQHYGREAAQAIWSATRCKVVFGGLTDQASISELSEAIPEERVVVAGESNTDKGPKGSKHVSWRKLLSAAQLREIPSGWSLLVYLNLRARMLRQPLAHKRGVLARQMLPWAAIEDELEQPPLHVVRDDEEEEVA
ncbi:type IV secretory system conjugative DNA transfer family protein [Candidatus Nephthysia bennettiae]|uniref:Type IV secretory system conjugative DNA transfer family protein n=1 Tax=Candidatus Nephthysia bennettiae TaxID=3127016 RepID=A0A934K1C5_9BACT|nr:type IV secretory system conjugative DNA transfer family protein [Candidatus Dormibacteraeota bacterium]